MANAVWRPQAESDLEDILYFIAKEDGRPATAAKIEMEIQEKIVLYAESPDIGQRYSGLSEDTRYCIHKRWAIFYRAADSGIEVLRVKIRPVTFQSCLVASNSSPHFASRTSPSILPVSFVANADVSNSYCM